MARTQDEILQSLVESLRAIDQSVDVAKGPVYNFLLRPVPIELQKTEADVERLTILTTQQLDRVATEDEIAALATNFSIRLGGGRASRTRNQTFYTSTRPTSDVAIDRGILIGTEDQRYTYFVSERAVLPANTIDNFYNAATRRYEISAPCEATAVGPDFDLPPTRVSKLITRVPGIDGTVNNNAYEGGQEAETGTNAVDRIRAKFAGLDPETGGGIKSDIRNFDPENVTDVSLVYPKDRALFRRYTARPAIDAYVIGAAIETTSETYVATGGETTLSLAYQPVDTVTSVTVNGTNVTFDTIEDTSRETGGSAIATTYVLLETALVAADVVTTQYSYNALIYEMQDQLFGLERPFDTDVLAREPRILTVDVSIDATLLPSADEARVYVAIESKLYDLIETAYFQDILQPEIVREQLRDSVTGIATLRVTRFRRSTVSIADIETVPLQKNEVARINQNTLEIRVRK